MARGSPPAAGRLHGREVELEQLVAAFAGCRSRHEGAVVVVHGLPGIGTSALVRAFRDQLRERRLAHGWWLGRCSRRAPLAYEPVAGLLRDVPGDVATWLAEGAEAGGAEAAGLALVAGLARRVRAAANERPLVLVVDDVDGADASTLQLLSGLVPLLDDVPVLVVLAGRSGDDGRVAHGLEALVEQVVAGHVRGQVVVMDPLDPEHVTALAREVAPELDGDALRAVVAAADGRPALATALASAPDAERTLAALLDGLHPAAASAVVVADLAGGHLEVSAAAMAAGAPVEVWDLLQSQRVLRPSDVDALVPVPASDLWAAAARRSLGAGGATALAARVAPLLDTTAPAAVAATVWESAGRADVAASRWVTAAGDAEARLAVDTAAVALRRAIELGGDAVLREVGVRAADLSLVAGDRHEAEAIARRLLPRLDRHDVPARLAVLLVSYRARLEGGLPDHDEPLDRALELAAPACRAHVDVLVVDALRRVFDDPVAAGRTAITAWDEARALDDLAATAHAAGAAGLAAAMAGRLDDGLAHFEVALDAAARSGDAALEARLASNRVFVLWRAGRPADVVLAAQSELDRLAVRGLSALGDQLAVARVVGSSTLGRLDEAEAAVAAARAMKLSADPVAYLDLVDASIALWRGEVDRAAVLVERVASSPIGSIPDVAGELHAVQAEVALARGDRSAARRAVAIGLERCGAGDLVSHWRLALVWWRAYEPGRTDDDPPATDGLEVVGRELAASAATVAALRDRSVAGWMSAREAWDAVPAPLEVLRCELALAALDRDLAAIDAVATAARELGALGLVAEADAVFRAAGGRRAPTRVPGLLSARELEVLACVAEGLTNREIAERLFISVRTAGAHLERCATKLGVRTRGAAVHEARRRGLMP
ncbi:MAG: LuxR family transcriptional regulator [Acidimicrobiales bacterium]